MCIYIFLARSAYHFHELICSSFIFRPALCFASLHYVLSFCVMLLRLCPFASVCIASICVASCVALCALRLFALRPFALRPLRQLSSSSPESGQGPERECNDGTIFRIGFCTVHEHGSPLGGMRINKMRLSVGKKHHSIAKPNSVRSPCRPSPCAELAPNLVLNLRRQSPCADLAPNLVLNLRRPSPCAELALNSALNLRRTQI
jgi:hypothetical protein